MKRRFTIRYEWWSAVLLIDESKAAELIKDSVEFWGDWESDVRLYKGDYTKIFVRNIAPLLLEESFSNGRDWIREQSFLHREGYCMALTEESGIQLLKIDEWEFDEDEINITED